LDERQANFDAFHAERLGMALRIGPGLNMARKSKSMAANNQQLPPAPYTNLNEIPSNCCTRV